VEIHSFASALVKVRPAGRAPTGAENMKIR
jgi:hypothetical protein